MPDRDVRLIVRWPRRTWRFSLVGAWRNHVRCALLGHDGEIVAGERLIALRCRRCGWRSPGWDLNPRVRKSLRSRSKTAASPASSNCGSGEAMSMSDCRAGAMMKPAPRFDH
jgi:hypothetical protein